jgi:hypothetical protein
LQEHGISTVHRVPVEIWFGGQKMRRLLFPVLVAFLTTVLACNSYRAKVEGEGPASPSSTSPGQPGGGAKEPAALSNQRASQDRPSQGPNPAAPQELNAPDSDNAQQAFDRKIIRNADLTIETDAPTEGQRRIASAVESHGGFIVTSEATQRDGNDSSKPDVMVKLVARVPAAKFQAVLNAIHGMDGKIKQEKTSGQDVTEEYIDLEAQIKAKRALEEQFINIMKQARSIQDALDVQTHLASVRTEIERLEGRRRFLENQSSLSTITVTLAPPAVLINTNPTGFAHELKVAFGEGFDAAAAVVLFLVRVILALLPIGIFIILPVALIVRFFLQRARRARLGRELESVTERS